MKIEIRSNDSVNVEGYVNAVGRDSRILHDIKGQQFVEQVAPGTFQRAIDKGEDIAIMANHDYVVGSVKKGNLELREDSIGLYAKSTINDKAVVEAARSGNLRGWSFGFNVVKDKFENTSTEGLERRILEDINLSEVSILTNKIPAYYGTSVEARGEDENQIEIRCFANDEKIELVDKAKEEEERAKEEAEKRDVFYANKKAEIELLKLKGKKKDTF